MTRTQTFSDLSTEKFRLRMRPYALEIYRDLFPGCNIVDLRAEGGNVHPLDSEYGIDTEIRLNDGHTISLQEKYRAYKYYASPKLRIDPNCPDFTQEYMNGDGTKYERKGEWFHLMAQLYFYGWANQEESEFERWVLLDVFRYKQIVQEAGGLDNIGEKRYNKVHGRASFFAIPCLDLFDSWVAYKGFGTVSRGVLWYQQPNGQIQFIPVDAPKKGIIK